MATSTYRSAYFLLQIDGGGTAVTYGPFLSPKTRDAAALRRRRRCGPTGVYIKLEVVHYQCARMPLVIPNGFPEDFFAKADKLYKEKYAHQ